MRTEDVQAGIFEIERQAIRKAQDRSFRQGVFCRNCLRALDSQGETDIQNAAHENSFNVDVEKSLIADEGKAQYGGSLLQ